MTDESPAGWDATRPLTQDEWFLLLLARVQSLEEAMQAGDWAAHQARVGKYLRGMHAGHLPAWKKPGMP